MSSALLPFHHVALDSMFSILLGFVPALLQRPVEGPASASGLGPQVLLLLSVKELGWKQKLVG
jgi:hypothetical protein